METRPLNDGFGIEVSGIDLKDPKFSASKAVTAMTRG